MRYLNGGIQELELDDLAYDKWEAKNSTILSWPLHSMQPDISQGYLFLCIAKEIQEATSLTYSKMGNADQIYELERQIPGASDSWDNLG